MGMEGGWSLIRMLVLLLVAMVLILFLTTVATGKTEALGCSWADQLVSAFKPLYSIFGDTPPEGVC